MPKQIHALLLAIFLSFSVGNAIANDPAPGDCSANELFVNLTSDDTWQASMDPISQCRRCSLSHRG